MDSARNGRPTMDVLYRNMAVLIEYPLLAAVPGALFVALFAVSRKLLVLTAAGAWLAYLPYEYAMKLRLLCSGECNIRLDLVVLYPVLFIISLVGLTVSARALVEMMRTRSARARARLQ
jgi:hypothetical protein